jgi:hypothetical protein
VDHRALAERYASTIRRRRLVARMVPWPLIVQIVLWAIQYFLLDARAGRHSVDEVLGPLRADGLYTGDIPDDVVADWKSGRGG